MFAFHYHCDMLLEVAEGIQTVCICVGAMQLFFLFPISFPLKQRMQQLESVFYFLFWSVLSNESLTSKNALSISLYLIGCITGSLSHQPLYHRCSEYQVKKKHLPSHFLKICVQSTDIFKHRRIYKSIYILCHRYNVKYDVFYAKVFAVSPLFTLSTQGVQQLNS